jgi:hypothetical protein
LQASWGEAKLDICCKGPFKVHVSYIYVYICVYIYMIIYIIIIYVYCN